MKITLKDGSVKEYGQAMSVLDIAKDLSEGLARVACAGEVNGQMVDLRTVVEEDASVNILTAKDEKGLSVLRHTASHVMAQAVKRLYPDAKLAIGPSIADGFYYDMDFDTPLTNDDLEKIEAEMKGKKAGEKSVKEAVLKVALGYSLKEVTEEYGVEDGELKLVKRKETLKDVPPDLKAAKLLLEEDDYTAFTDEELEAEKKRLLKQLKEET